MATDVLVVGAGIGGLTAAACCARQGLSVVVLEGSSRVGGRASTDDVEGYRFDRGAHALYCGGEAERVLASLGVALTAPKAFTTGSSTIFEGQVHPLPDTLGSVMGASWLGAGGRMALAGWFARVGLGSPPEGTVEDWLAPLPDPVRALAAALVRVSTYSADLHRMDARLAAAQVRLGATHGVRYVEGGWQGMVDGLRARAEALGVEIRTGTAARSVAPGLVATDQGDLRAPIVVLAVPPDRAEALLGTSLPDRPAPSRVAALQLALRDDVVVGPTRRLVLSTDVPVFLSNFSPVVPMGPAGAQVVHAIRYLPDDAPADDALGDLERTLDLVWPRWREGELARRFLPSMVTAGGLPAPGRPRLAVDAVEGVLLAGDAYGDRGHLADAAFASGEEAARHAVARIRARAA
ncbi:MAG: NAD(P)/FAD-dependent oxidoreductase [Myxococcales bacterium]|nr:NAD(P)/FAD-dependent oxidoreductase [Myxococcales bacterium]